MRIRPETEGDGAAIGELTLLAFTGHPQHAPGAAPTEHRIVEALRRSGALSLSLVAEDGGIVGHVAFSPVAINGERNGWYGLGPVSVSPSRQRSGIGSALIREGLGIMRQRGARGVVLVGEPDYYGRFGFKAFNALTMEGVPGEYLLALPFVGEEPAGRLEFDEGFFVN